MFAATNLQQKVINLSVNIVKNCKEITTFGDIAAMLTSSTNNENDSRELIMHTSMHLHIMHIRMGNELGLLFLENMDKLQCNSFINRTTL